MPDNSPFDDSVRPEDVDPGEPLAELAMLVEEPGMGFLERVRVAIQRRVTATHFLDFSLPLLFQIAGEYVLVFFSLFASPNPPTGDE